MTTEPELRWFRDQGRGQEAADAVGAKQEMDGVWPVANWPCKDYKESDMRWQHLLKVYGVNAMTYYPSQGTP